jgi:hypothetical protein
LDPAKIEVFLCGSPEMIGIGKEMLARRAFTASRGKEPGTLHVEEYW